MYTETSTSIIKVFEKMLDEKMDTLRLDVFQNSTPLPPPAITAEVQESLTSSIIEAIKDELPLRRPSSMSMSVPHSSAGNADLGSSVLVAVRETQQMLQNIQNVGSESMRDILKTLEDRLAVTTPTRSDQDYLVAKIVDALEHRMSMHRGHTGQLVHKETQRTSVNDAVAQALEASLPTVLERNIAVFTPLPASPTLVSLSQTDLQSSLQELRVLLEERLSGAQSDREAYSELIESKHDVDLALARARAEICKVRAEHSAQQEVYEAERERLEDDIQELRRALAAKDAKLELLRTEMLNRATNLDSEREQREKIHLGQLEELKTLCGGMEMELAILREQSTNGTSIIQELRADLETAKEQVRDASETHRVQLGAWMQEAADAKAKLEVAEKHQHAHSQAAEFLQEEVRKHQLAREVAEGLLQEERALRSGLAVQLQEVSAEVKLLRESNVSMEASQAHHKRENQQLHRNLERQATRYTDEVEELQEQNHRLIALASQAHQHSLSLMISLDSRLSSAAWLTSFDSTHVFANARKKLPRSRGMRAQDSADTALDESYDHESLSVDGDEEEEEENGVRAKILEFTDGTGRSDLKVVQVAVPVLDDESGWFI